MRLGQPAQALLAAAHVEDSATLIYDIAGSDPIGAGRNAQILRNGDCVLSWSETKFSFTAPSELVGCTLWDMQSWLEQQCSATQEAARLLRWANILATGRTIPLAEQSDATRIPPNCYTFPPERAAVAQRVGEVKNFFNSNAQPLDSFHPFV